MTVTCRLYSDLHLGHSNYSIDPLPDDSNSVLILAGDISERNHAFEFVKDCCDRFLHVIYVLGNHEYYNGEYTQVNNYWESVAESIENLHVLNNKTLVVDNVRFVCTTLWTDMNHGEYQSKMIAARAMNDYYVIKHNDRKLSVDDTIGFHNDALLYLKTELSVPFDGITVVVTHHSPSPSLADSKYAGQTLNSAFHANCDFLFTDYKIDYFFYGHTHFAMTRKLGDTYVYSNPRGYVTDRYSEDTGIDHKWQLILK